MFTHKSEQDFLFSYLKPEFRVLEYGSGESTVEISKIVKEIVTVEHIEEWANFVKKLELPNATVLYNPPDLSYEEGIDGKDGTFEEFKTYIQSPKEYGKFDVIFIDGRARVECAKFAKQVANKNCMIFIHDFFSRQNSENYKEALKYLEIVSSERDMCRLRLL